MSRKRTEQNSGNSVAAQVQFDKEMYKVGVLLHRADDMFQRLFEEGVDVTRMSVVLPQIDKPDYLCVVTATIDGVKHVAFHGGSTYVEAVTGILNRLMNGSLKWRLDQN